jgi:predicted DNA-binding transcriptional regulator AlpA
MGIKAQRAAAEAAAAELLTDAEAARLLNLGATLFGELQRAADFPAPVWLGERAKRHVRTELLGWALKRRKRVGAINGGPSSAE